MVILKIFVHLFNSLSINKINNKVMKESVNILGKRPNMDEQDRVEFYLLEIAMHEYGENMDIEDLHAEIQAMLYDKASIPEIEVLFFVCLNSIEVSDTENIKTYVERGYEFILQYGEDEPHVMLSKIDNLDDYIII